MLAYYAEGAIGFVMAIIGVIGIVVGIITIDLTPNPLSLKGEDSLRFCKPKDSAFGRQEPAQPGSWTSICPPLVEEEPQAAAATTGATSFT